MTENRIHKMKRSMLLWLITLIVSATAVAKVDLVTLPRREKAQLTIYNSADLTLVREQRSLTLKKGSNLLELSWANTLIDPTSLSLEPLGRAGDIEIKQLAFPARVSQLGQWLIDSQINGKVSFEITYFTSGLSWRAFYMGTLSQDEKTMRRIRQRPDQADRRQGPPARAYCRACKAKIRLRLPRSRAPPPKRPRRRGRAWRMASRWCGSWFSGGLGL